MTRKRQITPAARDEDYLRIVLDAGTDVVVTKTEKKSDSSVEVGEHIRGRLSRAFELNRSLRFDNGRALSNISKVEIGGTTGEIILTTSTSVYKVTGLDQKGARRLATLQYHKKGYMDFDDFMHDGFVDGGRGTKFFLSATGEIEMESPRELIHVDKNQDPKLMQMVKETKELLSGITDERTKIKLLALYVSNRLGGSQPHGEKGDGIVERCYENINQVRQSNDVVQIGDMQHGFCRYRAVLFKKLADENGIKSRLVRGDYSSGGHAWNVVKLNGIYYVVDVMHDPLRLYKQHSKKAKKYTRINGMRQAAGGIGGRSITM